MTVLLYQLGLQADQPKWPAYCDIVVVIKCTML